MNRQLKSVVCMLTLSLTLATLWGCGDKDKSLARVGSSQITESDLESLGRVNPRLKPRLATPAGKEKILENYVEQELLYQESKRRGLDRKADIKEKVALYDKIIIAQALLDDELDRKVKEYFVSHKDEFERTRVSHIFIRTTPEKSLPEAKAAKNKSGKAAAPKPTVSDETTAKNLLEQAKERIAKGEDFGKVAKEISQDEKTKDNQGDLGYVTVHDKRLERLGWLPVAEKAFALKEGEVSDVIKTQDGLHLIKVTEAKKGQPVEEADASIRFKLQGDIRTQLLEDLKKRYKVEYTKAPSAEAPAPAAESQPAIPPAP